MIERRYPINTVSHYMGMECPFLKRARHKTDIPQAVCGKLGLTVHLGGEGAAATLPGCPLQKFRDNQCRATESDQRVMEEERTNPSIVQPKENSHILYK